jgi:hypothetical protein
MKVSAVIDGFAIAGAKRSTHHTQGPPWQLLLGPFDYPQRHDYTEQRQPGRAKKFGAEGRCGNLERFNLFAVKLCTQLYTWR